MVSFIDRALFPFLFLAAGGALAAAFIAQYIFDLEPCVLCLYQRVPYVAAAGLAAIGIFVAMVNRSHLAALIGLVFLAGAGVAFYHVGVEQHWWQAATACGSGAADLPVNFEAFRQGLGNLGLVKACDEVEWSLFGLSMATYNVAVSAGLAVICFAAARTMNGGNTA